MFKPHLRVSGNRVSSATHSTHALAIGIRATGGVNTIARGAPSLHLLLEPIRPRSTRRMRPPSPTLIALISASLAAGVLARVQQQAQLPVQTARGITRSIGVDASSSLQPLPHSTISADANHDDQSIVAASYHRQLAAPALFVNIAPGDRPPECPPCNPFNCVLPAFPCLNTGTLVRGISADRDS